MRALAENYHSDITRLAGSIRTTINGGKETDFYHGIEAAGKTIISHVRSGNKIIFIGNGGSAAISSHMAIDFWKNGGMRAVTFNDSALLTCISNDYGYEHVFEKPIEMFGKPGDVLVAISSSGMSENILKGVEAAREKKCSVITLSGFTEDNSLRVLGDVNFYVPDSSYGRVELLHHFVCHCLLDVIMEKVK